MFFGLSSFLNVVFNLMLLCFFLAACFLLAVSKTAATVAPCGCVNWKSHINSGKRSNIKKELSNHFLSFCIWVSTPNSSIFTCATTTVNVVTTSCEKVWMVALVKKEQNKKHFLRIWPSCFYVPSEGLPHFAALKAIFVLEIACVCIKQQLQISIQLEHKNRWDKLPLEGCGNIFLFSLSFFSLTTQSQAVSDGGKNQPAFPVTLACLCVNVCF